MENKILELYNAGLSIREISRQTQKSTTFINKTILLNKTKDLDFYNDKNLDDDHHIIAICKKTKKEIYDFKNQSGTITLHLQEVYPNFKIESKYKRKQIELTTGKFWYHNFFDFITKKITTKNCKYCDWNTIDINNVSGCYTVHLQNAHNISTSQYLIEFPYEVNLFSTFINKETLQKKVDKSELYGVECKICNKFMRKITNTHLKNHNINIATYKRKYGKTISKYSSNLISIASTENNKIYTPKRKNTWIEVLFKNKLQDLNLNYNSQVENNNFYYDFFLNDHNLYIETDGSFWHGHDRSGKWYFNQFNNIINDYKKHCNVNKLIRLVENNSINHSNMNQISSKDSLFVFFEKENFLITDHKLFNLKEDDVIFDKNYCNNKQDIFLKENVDKNLLFLINNFYSPDKFINFVNLDSRRTHESKLKAIFFNSFYSAHKVGSKNLAQIFENKEMLLKTIQYRLGINEANELFDINIKNIYRGIEVRTMFNVGIFPVNKAKEIYEKYVTEHNSIIFDPFAGWGSRILGAKELIKDLNCHYIGHDTNLDLENGYSQIISSNFINYQNKAQLLFEDSTVFKNNLLNKVDFIFTSPPFYNDEIYHKNQLLYKDMSEWINSLIKPVFQNCFNYLKKDKFVLIDIKALYSELIIICLNKIGFKYIGSSNYKVQKSHYATNTKEQNILIFKK